MAIRMAAVTRLSPSSSWSYSSTTSAGRRARRASVKFGRLQGAPRRRSRVPRRPRQPPTTRTCVSRASTWEASVTTPSGRPRAGSEADRRGRAVLRARHRVPGRGAGRLAGGGAGVLSSDWKIRSSISRCTLGKTHGSALESRAVLEPLFVKYGVSAAFSGHDHLYERIKPQKGGIVYWVAGGGGSLRRGTSQPRT